MKQGILTKEEGKFFAKFAAEHIPVSGFWKQSIKLLLPTLLDGLDDRYGDRIPEPWQSHLEELVTILYNVLQDGVLDEGEIQLVLEKCANIVADEVETPLINGDDEVAAYLFILKALASFIQSGLKK